MQDKIRKIMALLNSAYGRVKPFKKDDPVDVLIRTVLSQNTSDRNSVPAFYRLKRHFASWDKVAAANTAEITPLIKHAGLANIKAKRIKGVLEGLIRENRGREGRFRRGGGHNRWLRADRSLVSLAHLGKLTAEEALEYLESLDGVGPKTAACVLLFGFGMPVMPVDTHIFRVSKRLGLIDKGTGIEEAHAVLTKIVPKRLIYSFHLCIIEHGRLTCKAQTPKCGVCSVYGLCGFEDKTVIASEAKQSKKEIASDASHPRNDDGS